MNGDLADINADTQEINGDLVILTGHARIFTDGSYLTADKITRNLKTEQVTATGNVFYQNLIDGHKMACELAEYDLNTETGKFFKVRGEAPAQIETKPGMLTTTNPFYFQGETAEKVKDRYVLHNGFVTDCRPDDVWWKLNAKEFDIIPGDRAIARKSVMRLKDVPIFYFPWFRKSLQKQARHSGFLTPNIGNSSQRGQMVGLGYFWAINRSYDAMYRTQIYTRRGLVHEGNFNGWINSTTSFSLTAFGAGRSDELNLDGGYVISLEGDSYLPRGWEAHGELREVSSLKFRQQMTLNYDEATSAELQSVGFLTKHWSTYGFNLVAQRTVNFQTDNENDTVVIRKLPEAQFLVREHELGNLPLWFSLDANYGLDRRTQPLFQTRQFVQRLDMTPRVTSAYHLAGFDFAPSFGIRETLYDSRRSTDCDRNGVATIIPQVCGENLVRSSRDFQFDLGLPRLSRVFAAPRWMRAGDRVKHVFEARARYRYVTGINEFRDTIRFDETDILSNTHEIEFSLVNRLLRRDGAGGVEDVVSWQLWYKRYLDPTFGGAIIPGQRNVVDSSVGITGYAFLNNYRNQSPIASVFRVQQSRVGMEWRFDYDPVRQGFVNSTLSVDTRFGPVFAMASHSRVNTAQELAPKANQIRALLQYGGDNRRGWNVGGAIGYDFLKASKCEAERGEGCTPFQYLQSQATYNTDCCGFSVQYRRFNFNVISDNQFRLAFTLANIGSFGTLRRQERIF